MKKISLRNKQKEIAGYALVDNEDYKWLIEYNWHISSEYATTKCNCKTVRMHRLIYEKHFGKIEKYCVDHKNRNKLDNRKENLRTATNTENAINRKIGDNNISGYTGVQLKIDARQNIYSVGIKVNGKYLHIGSFNNIRFAGIAKDIYMKKFFSNDFLNLNVPDATKDEINQVKNIIKNPKKIKASSKYFCVSYRKKEKRWLAYITLNKERTDLGYFKTEEEAALAYNQKAKELLGDKARLNIING